MEDETNAEAVLSHLVSKRLARILSSAGIGTWAWDIESDIITWSIGPSETSSGPNLRFESIDELVKIAHPDEQDGLRDALRRSRATGENLRHRFRYHRADGSFGRVSLDGVCDGPDGAATAVVGISRDDTEEMNTEDRLALVFDERDRVARALETALLPPRLPSVPGLNIDAAYLSSDGAATGDFYDLFPLARGEWGLTIGDVGGHGAPAAAITASIRYALRAAALVRRNTVRVLQAANDAHFAATRDERFTTCHFVRMGATKSGKIRLRIATAGHPALIVKRANGAIEELTGQGPMLGMMRTPDFMEGSTDLEVGDTVLAYTDGVTEARRGGELFGEERLIALLQQWDGAIEGLAENVHFAAQEFAGGEPQDDMATVILRVKEPDEAAASS